MEIDQAEIRMAERWARQGLANDGAVENFAAGARAGGGGNFGLVKGFGEIEKWTGR